MLIKLYAVQRLPSIGTELSGSSPPGVFVGRWSYPYVYIGPLIPPAHGDTAFLDTPECWANKAIDEIVNFRFSLVRGKDLQNVHVAAALDTGAHRNSLVDATRELALAASPTDTEAIFTKRPAGCFIDGDVQPFGPSAPLRSLDISSLRADRHMDKAHSDTDLKAADAVLQLYRAGVPISKIQRAFSVGAFGIGRRRRLVPTRWSITAVDSIVSTALIAKTKTFPIINEYRIYEHIQLDNRWIVLMIPTSWRYELIEAWWPGTIWNLKGQKIEMFADHEFYDGRKGYPEIGGCYFAARLAINEMLNKERRQAGVVIFREAHSGYIMPVGVWNVREAVRAAIKKQPLKFDTLHMALAHAAERLAIPIQRWIRASAIIGGKRCKSR